MRIADTYVKRELGGNSGVSVEEIWEVGPTEIGEWKWSGPDYF